MTSDTPRRMIIVDQSLKDFDGHHYEYDLTVARSAAAAGLDVEILANAAFVPPAEFGFATTGWFADSSYAGGRGRLRRAFFAGVAYLPPGLRRETISAASALRRSVSPTPSRGARRPPLPAIGARLVDGLKRLGAGPGDHVFVHTLNHAELQAVVRALPDVPAGLVLHLLLRRDAEEPDVVSDAWGGLATALRQAVETPDTDLRLYSDTKRLAAQYDELIGARCVTVLPIPHYLRTVPSARLRTGGPLRLVYLGNARSEKGFDRLVQAARALRPWLSDGRVQLIAQSSIPVSLEEAAMARCVARLERYPPGQVLLIPEPLPVSGFQELLVSADIVLLPYRAEFYRRRSSGILVQAAVAGKPVVVPDGTWLAEAAPPGAAVTFGEDVAFADAVVAAIEAYPELSGGALRAAPAMSASHDADRLIETLLMPAGPSLS